MVESEMWAKTMPTVEVELLEGIEKGILVEKLAVQAEEASVDGMIGKLTGTTKIGAGSEIETPQGTQATITTNGSASTVKTS